MRTVLKNFLLSDDDRFNMEFNNIISQIIHDDVPSNQEIYVDDILSTISDVLSPEYEEKINDDKLNILLTLLYISEYLLEKYYLEKGRNKIFNLHKIYLDELTEEYFPEILYDIDKKEYYLTGKWEYVRLNERNCRKSIYKKYIEPKINKELWKLRYYKNKENEEIARNKVQNNYQNLNISWTIKRKILITEQTINFKNFNIGYYFDKVLENSLRNTCLLLNNLCVKISNCNFDKWEIKEIDKCINDEINHLNYSIHINSITDSLSKSKLLDVMSILNKTGNFLKGQIKTLEYEDKINVMIEEIEKINYNLEKIMFKIDNIKYETISNQLINQNTMLMNHQTELKELAKVYIVSRSIFNPLSLLNPFNLLNPFSFLGF